MIPERTAVDVRSHGAGIVITVGISSKLPCGGFSFPNGDHSVLRQGATMQTARSGDV